MRPRDKVKLLDGLLKQCPDPPDDFHWANKDAVEAFEQAFREWKEEVRRGTNGTT